MSARVKWCASVVLLTVALGAVWAAKARLLSPVAPQAPVGIAGSGHRKAPDVPPGTSATSPLSQRKEMQPSVGFEFPVPPKAKETDVSSNLIAAIPGRVVDLNGQPVPNCTIGFRYPGQPDNGCSGRADTSGCFVLRPDVSRWYTKPTDSVFLSARSGSRLGTAELFICQKEADVDTVHNLFPNLQTYLAGQAYNDPMDYPVIVVQSAGSVRGVVLDIAGRPLSGVEVCAVPDRALTDAVSARSNNAGQYRIDALLPGPCQLRAIPQPELEPEERSGPSLTINVASGMTTTAPHLVINQPDQDLTVCVMDRSGRRVANASVDVVPAFSRGKTDARTLPILTGPDGTTTVHGLYTGDYAVSASRYYGMPFAGSCCVSVPGPPAIVRLDGESEVCGLVTDERTGEPLNDFYVLALSGNDPNSSLVWENVNSRSSREDQGALLETLERVKIPHFLNTQGRFNLKVSRTQLGLYVFARGYHFSDTWPDFSSNSYPGMVDVSLPPMGWQPSREEEEASYLEEESEVGSEEQPESESDASANVREISLSDPPFGWLSVQVIGYDGLPISASDYRIFDMDEPFWPSDIGSSGRAPYPDDLWLRPGRYRVYVWPRTALCCMGTRPAIRNAVQIRKGTRYAASCVLPQGDTTLVGDVRVNGLHPQRGDVCAFSLCGDLLAAGHIDDGGRFVLPQLPAGRLLLRLDIHEGQPPMIRAVTSFQSLTLPRSGITRESFNLTQGEPRFVRIGSIEAADHTRLAVLPRELSVARVLGFHDELELDVVQAEVEACGNTGTFVLSGLAAGDYKLAAFITALDEECPGSYPWTDSDWVGSYLEFPLSLEHASGYGGQVHIDADISRARALGAGKVLDTDTLDDGGV